MSDQQLLTASQNGDFESVQRLLAYDHININCKDILIQHH